MRSEVFTHAGVEKVAATRQQLGSAVGEIEQVEEAGELHHAFAGDVKGEHVLVVCRREVAQIERVPVRVRPGRLAKKASGSAARLYRRWFKSKRVNPWLRRMPSML